ncbi:MAG: efflux RND transporter permease subunit, partial [Candidatus Krumholzibacteria bacterium]|nr:efflux RND transporter permease subunit [Candidatus Krumholzibacteria bacterium]
MEGRGLYGSILSLALKNRFLVFLAVLLLTLWGLSVSPFGSGSSLLPGNPVPVDAIPDLSENQQIVFSEWPGRSPRDVEDQISYPLTVSLMGMPGVRTVRSYSMTGFSTLYVIFEEGVDFYWARSRVLEKLASLPAGSLPEGVSPTLGPDATALGQIFWYTLEGRDAEGQPVGGWDPDELRSVQDYQVRYALLSADGVAEVASVGGYVREYQVDVDPEALRAWDVSLEEVARAIRQSNRDVGARTLEVNSVEYLVRGLGRIDSLNDLEHTVVKAREGSPVLLRDLASLTLGPAGRRGVLDRDGVEAVGGVVVVRFGENPLEAIQNVKERIAEISAGLPEKNLDDGRVSKLHIVPFYDRTQLIEETLGTLESALEEEVLV